MPKNSTVIEQRRKFVEWHNQSDSGLMHPNFAQAMYYYQEDSNSWHVRQNEQALKEGVGIRRYKLRMCGRSSK